MQPSSSRQAPQLPPSDSSSAVVDNGAAPQLDITHFRTAALNHLGGGRWILARLLLSALLSWKVLLTLTPLLVLSGLNHATLNLGAVNRVSGSVTGLVSVLSLTVLATVWALPRRLFSQLWLPAAILLAVWLWPH